MTVSAVKPCRTALRRERFFPASVFGPVLLNAFRRLASIWLNVAMRGRDLALFWLMACSAAVTPPITLGVSTIRRVSRRSVYAATKQLIRIYRDWMRFEPQCAGRNGRI